MMHTPPAHRTRTLLLAAVLHAFTHVYQVALLPLYIPIQQDFKLPGVAKATLLVTVLMIAYFVPSYPLGALADRVSRKKLLGLGLAINGAGFIGLAFAPNYATALLSVIVAGFGGSFYHPAATAMIARLYPVGTGRALGIVGMGASVGFFLGPIYCGWRAATAGWRAPVLELGILGLLGAVAFAFLAREETAREVRPVEDHHIGTLFPNTALWLFIGSLISNPIFGGLSDRGRFRWGFVLLFLAAVMVAIFPHLPRAGIIPAFILYGFFFMATFPVVEAALMESVPDAVRGRVFGFFITIGGLCGNLSHWLIGKWVQRLGPSGDSAPAYYPYYGFLACLVLLSMLGLPCLKAIRKREGLAIGAHEAPIPLPSQPSPAPRA